MYLYLKMGQIFIDFNQPIFQQTPKGESQLRSLYRSGKAFLQEQGNLVIWKISQGKHGHFLTFFGIDFASDKMNKSQVSRMLLGCQTFCEPSEKLG